MAAKSFLSSNSNGSAASSFTFTSQTLGTAASDRYIVLVVGGDAGDGVGTAPTSVTVQGITSTILQTKTAGRDSTSLCIVAVPTGTTGDIVVNWPKSMRSCGVGWYRVTGLSSATPYDIQGTSSGGGSSLSVNVNVPNNAIVIAAGHTANGSDSWTGLTKDFDTADGFSTIGSSSASGTPSAQSGYTVTYTTGAGDRLEMIAASWGDAPATINGNFLTVF